MVESNWSDRRPRRFVSILGVVMLAMLLSACTIHGKSKTAHEQGPPANASPGAVNQLPANIDEVSVDITNGAFSTNGIVFQQGSSILHLVNHDGTIYQFEITPNLVTARPVAANATTDVSFTAPSSGTFTGHLTAQQGGAVLGTLSITIQPAGGVNP